MGENDPFRFMMDRVRAIQFLKRLIASGRACARAFVAVLALSGTGRCPSACECAPPVRRLSPLLLSPYSSASASTRFGTTTQPPCEACVAPAAKVAVVSCSPRVAKPLGVTRPQGRPLQTMTIAIGSSF